MTDNKIAVEGSAIIARGTEIAADITAVGAIATAPINPLFALLLAKASTGFATISEVSKIFHISLGGQSYSSYDVIFSGLGIASSRLPFSTQVSTAVGLGVSKIPTIGVDVYKHNVKMYGKREGLHPAGFYRK